MGSRQLQEGRGAVKADQFHRKNLQDFTAESKRTENQRQ